jgi:hypothetical protein
MPDFSDDTIFRYFWIHTNVFPCCQVCPVLINGTNQVLIWSGSKLNSYLRNYGSRIVHEEYVAKCRLAWNAGDAGF